MKRLRLEHKLEEHEGCVNCINFSPSGQLLASGSDDLQVVLWDWVKGTKMAKFESGHIANVFQVSLGICDGHSLVYVCAFFFLLLYFVQ